MGLDYYNGYQVTDVHEEEGGWSIGLEGNIRIVNEDSEIPMPENLEGLSFLTVSLSQHGTTIQFGRLNAMTGTLEHQQEVTLNPTKHHVADRRLSDGPIYPQAEAPAEEPAPETPEAPAEEPQEAPEAPEEAPDEETPAEEPAEA